MVEPYIDQFEEDGSRIRTFSSEIDSGELIWHRDKKDREITILSGVGWKLQMEDKLPKELELGKLYDIPKEGESKSYAARRRSFKARHAKNIAKGKTSAAYWADKVKW